MNWDDARIFLAVQREKTLRSAARRLGVDQATVGRRVVGLEQALGATLFLRTSNGLALTAAGDLVRQAAELMEQSAQDLEREVLGSDQRLEGNVRVATTDSLALEFVIPALSRLRRSHPGIAITLVASTDILNLTRREADIAIRTIAPESPDLVARRLVSWPIGLFASPDYLERCGEPAVGQAFAGHDLVMFEPHLARMEQLTLAGEPIGAGRIVASAASSLMVRSMIRAGLGVGETAAPLAERDGLVRIWPDRSRSEPYDIWLVTHEDLRRAARVRAVIDELVSTFSEVK